MSGLLKNKLTLVHIACEVVVIVGLTFYFSKKNKVLMRHVADLTQRVEEQEELLHKHDKALRELAKLISSNARAAASVNNPPPPVKPLTKPLAKPDTVPEKVTEKAPERFANVVFQSTRVVATPSNEEVATVEEVSDDESEGSELDEELEEELGELEKETDLKKPGE